MAPVLHALGADRPSADHDRYLIGTRFRLRRMDAPNEQVFKLTQKVRSNPDSPERVRLTNTYGSNCNRTPAP